MSIVQYMIFMALKSLFFLLPRKTCVFIGKAMGILAYTLDSSHRQVALSNLKIAFANERREPELQRIAKDSFIHFGQMAADLLKLFHSGKRRREKIITWEGQEYLEQALKEGRGVLIFSAHFGNWEIASHVFSRIGKFLVMARPLDNPFLERELLKFRARLGASVIYKQQAVRKVIQALRRNEIVAIVIDQNVLRSQAVFVDFFGKKAATTPSLAAFSLRTQSPIIPIFCLPLPGQSYHVRILKPVRLEKEGGFDDNVLKITQICTKIIEHEIRENPVFWLWVHKRWRTRPEEENSQGETQGLPNSIHHEN